MAAEGQSDKMVSHMKVHMKQSGQIEFFQEEKKMVPIDIHWHLLNVYGDQTVHMSTVRRWVVYFSSVDSDSVVPLLVQIFMSMARRVLLTAGNSA